MQLERELGIARNPLINAGAIVVTEALLEGRGHAATIAEILDTLRTLAHDKTVTLDEEVAQSEAATGYRNASLPN